MLNMICIHNLFSFFLQGSLPFGKVLVNGETALILGSTKLSAVHEGKRSIRKFLIFHSCEKEELKGLN